MSTNFNKKIICLANSRKHAGRCVAGKETDKPNRWVRPVSSKATGELSEDDMSFPKSHVLRPLDIVQICMLEARPQSYQSENYAIDQGVYWTFNGKALFSDVLSLVDQSSGTLWHNGSSSYHGIHDRVHTDEIQMLSHSLKLVVVDDLVIRVLAEQASFGNNKLRVRGFFTWGSVRYGLSVTDPEFEDNYRSGGHGEYQLGRAVLCLSLGEIYSDGYAYKLVAGIILPP